MRKIVSRGEEVYSPEVFEILLQYEVSRSQRYPAPLTLIQIEASPTALSNEAREKAFSIFTTKINVHIRSVDIPSIMGNRIRVLFPTTDSAGARVICDRLLSIFKNKIDDAIVFSLQIGACSHSGGPSLTSEILLQNSETALAQSKLKGPNTFVQVAK